jgi:hypothetical protein
MIGKNIKNGKKIEMKQLGENFNLRKILYKKCKNNNLDVRTILCDFKILKR